MLFIGVVHIVYGEVAQISGLLAITQAPIIIGSTRVMILQGGIILIAMALLQIADSRRGGVLTGVAATFPLGLIVVNFAAFLLVALSGSPALLADAIPQVVYVLILIVLQAIALSKKLRARYDSPEETPKQRTQ